MKEKNIPKQIFVSSNFVIHIEPIQNYISKLKLIFFYNKKDLIFLFHSGPILQVRVSRFANVKIQIGGDLEV